MNHQSANRTISSLGAAVLLVLGLTRCSLLQKNCCGYQGPVTADPSITLYAKDHFIPKTLIDDWTARYEGNQSLLQKIGVKVGINLPSPSCSFSGRFVRLLLCNKKSIGIRVLCGLDTSYEAHIILVGINPDYSTLYIPRPLSLKAKGPVLNTNGTDVGGLQFSQKP